MSKQVFRFFGTGMIWNKGTDKSLVDFGRKGYIDTSNESLIVKLKAHKPKLRFKPLNEIRNAELKQQEGLKEEALPNNLLKLRSIAKELDVDDIGSKSIPELKTAILKKREEQNADHNIANSEKSS